MSAHDRLASLHKEAEAEKGRSRDMAANIQSAKTKTEDAYARLVEAHADGAADKVKAAQRAHKAAKDQLEARHAEAQGAELRATRAEFAVTAFYRDNADALLEEKRERCEQIPASSSPACVRPSNRTTNGTARVRRFAI